MSLDATARIQAASGTVTTSTTSFTPALPNPTIDGSTLLLYTASNQGSLFVQDQGYDPPWIQDQFESSLLYAWRRPDQPGGETSWPVTAFAAGTWIWRVEEWCSLSTVSQPDAISVPQFNLNTQNHLTGTATADISDFAAVAVWRMGGSSGGATAWPAGRSYSSGWSETDFITIGDGTLPSHQLMAIAEAYPGASGSVASTLTWDTTGGGDYSNKSSWGWAICWRPSVPQPYGVVTA